MRLENIQNPQTPSVPVSHGRHVMDNRPQQVDLLQTIKAAHYSEELRGSIEKIRHTQRDQGKDGAKKLKQELPYVIVPGLTDGKGTKKSNWSQTQPILAIDIDDLEPDEATECRDKLHEELGRYAYYFGLSPSGHGVRGFIRIQDAESYMDHWRALCEKLRKIGYEQDKKTKNPVQKYYLTCDPEAFIPDDPNQVEAFEEKIAEPSSQKGKTGKNSNKNEDVANKLERYVQEIEKQEVDITTDRDQHWLRCGFAIIDGARDMEHARELFHRVSKFHPEYDPTETEDFFNDLASRHQPGEDKVEVGTFFKLCEQNEKLQASLGTKKEKKKKITLADAERFIMDNYELWFNSMLKITEIRDKSSGKLHKLEDRDLESIVHRVQRDLSLGISRQNIITIIESDVIPAYNPITYYFQHQDPYDEQTEPDWIRQLAATVKPIRVGPDGGEQDDSEWWYYAFRKWLVAMVASWMQRHITNHQILVLGGEQGIGKSTWMGRLLPKQLQEYIYVGPLKAGSKDSLEHISENLLVILDELSALDRSTVKDMKALITQGRIKFRKSYGRYPVEQVRNATFAGTTNDTEILRDPTGSRRWLVFWAESIDKDHEVPLDRVFAQAKKLYEDGFQYWFEGEDIDRIENRNEDHRIVPLEEELLTKLFKPCEVDKADAYLNASGMIREINQSRLGTTIDERQKSKLGTILARYKFRKIKRNGIQRYAVQLTEHARNEIYVNDFHPAEEPDEFPDHLQQEGFDDPLRAKDGPDRSMWGLDLDNDRLWNGDQNGGDPGDPFSDENDGQNG